MVRIVGASLDTRPATSETSRGSCETLDAGDGGSANMPVVTFVSGRGRDSLGVWTDWDGAGDGTRGKASSFARFDGGGGSENPKARRVSSVGVCTEEAILAPGSDRVGRRTRL